MLWSLKYTACVLLRTGELVSENELNNTLTEGERKVHTVSEKSGLSVNQFAVFGAFDVCSLVVFWYSHTHTHTCRRRIGHD